MESSSLSSLQPEAEALRQDIEQLKTEKSQILEQQLQMAQNKLTQLLQEDLQQLEERKKNLQITVEQLERRQERIQAEMRQTFAGASQELAIRVQGFKDYLVTSLQDVALAAEQLKLVPAAAKPELQSADSKSEVPKLLNSRAPESKSAESRAGQAKSEPNRGGKPSTQPQFSTQSFQDETRQIRRLLEQYRTTPNYYGPPWQLRRTFEPIHADRVAKWFFKLGGRGAIKGMGSRLQNILVGSAVISILNELYGERVQTLILAKSPESLGDWRRGLQDCLGLERIDFGPDQGVALFESPDALAQKAERLVRTDDLPFILLDDSEETVSLAVLQFPLWLAFVPEPQLRRERQPLDWFD